MLRKLAAVAALVTISSTAGSCGCNGAVKRPYAKPTAESVLQTLRDHNALAQSFRAKSTMDYWVGKERVKGTVLVQGKVGASMRFNALNPGSGNVAVDLACSDGNFKYLNYNDDCKLVGPCDKSSIAQLLRVGMEPDHFLLLAMGSAPILDGDASLSWNEKGGYEVITIKAASGARQVLQIDLKSDRVAVVFAELTGSDGKTDWKLTNKDFSDLETEDGKPWRLPGKSRFEQPKDKADLIVDWKERTLNLPLEPELFDFQLNMGIANCGS